MIRQDCREDGEGRIKAATVSAPHIDATARSYQDYLGYITVDEGTVSPEQAWAWGASKMEGKRQIVMGPESGTKVYIRLVENEPVPDYEYLKTFGWNAIEITVTDVEALNDRLKESPFKIIGDPTYLDFSDKIYPMQAVGLADEVFYLNQVRGNLPDYDLPMARSFVDHIFIMILAAPDVQKAVDFYLDHFGWSQGNTYHVKYGVINDAFNLPEETPHYLSMTCVGRIVNNEIDQYPEGTTIRPGKEGLLPPGIAMTSYIVEDLDRVKAPFISPPLRLGTPPYEGRRSACCIGAAGELIELIEAR
ncbi:VOC family protein [Luteithermobacter gelatinilyticus]|uniref:VOC family protein n=1 Tax=Luteithermobacter gelatinilyticus TaxID=2582913 RepID=UPI00110597EC|nr:VOC family protein [Luteithermobacter gelatinilyticus]